MDVRDWSVRGAKSVRSLLLFFNIEHYSAKKELKSSAFWRKSVMNYHCGIVGGMIEIFFIIYKTFWLVHFWNKSCIDYLMKAI